MEDILKLKKRLKDLVINFDGLTYVSLINLLIEISNTLISIFERKEKEYCDNEFTELIKCLELMKNIKF